MSRLQFLGLCVVVLVSSWTAVAEPAEYLTNAKLNKWLTERAAEEPKLMRLTTLAGKGASRVQVAELGSCEGPAILLVAGIEGNDLVGSSIAVGWIDHLLDGYGSDEAITKLLDTTTIYVIARLNTIGPAGFFGKLRCETQVTRKPVDDDHDGLRDEDGPEDLNGDGMITSMRIEDPDGSFILDPQDSRLMLEADPLKGESGRWKVLTEGIDNDKDERWNEDGVGGVNFNRNFPYDYDFFAVDSGIHQVSEVRTRALADFVVAHPNIALVVTYGSADNLLKTPSASSADGRSPTRSINTDDIDYYRVIGESYRKTLGLERELQAPRQPGTFSDWMYFHRGRMSLAICPWSGELARALPVDAPEAESEESEDREDGDKEQADKTPADNRNRDQREQLAWFDKNAPEAFVSWERIEHPDYPGKVVEVGGYAPFALSNPPQAILGGLFDKHAAFLTETAGRLPRIAVRGTTVHHAGKGVYDITMVIENTGFLPTVLIHGARTRQINTTRLVLKIDDKRILSGQRVTIFGPIKGMGGKAETRWVVHAPDLEGIEFELVSALAGQVSGTIELKDGRK